jgi:hypothetical protein
MDDSGRRFLNESADSKVNADTYCSVGFADVKFCWLGSFQVSPPWADQTRRQVRPAPEFLRAAA